MLYILASITLILLFIYTMPLIASIDTGEDGKNNKITLSFKAMYGLFKLKLDISGIKMIIDKGRPLLRYKIEAEGGIRNKLINRIIKLMSLEEGKNVYKAYKNNRNVIISSAKYITSKSKIRNFDLRLDLGTGDAAATGVLYGIAWAAIGSIMAFAKSRLNIDKHSIIVFPVFDKECLSIDFSCIISIKSGHIIYAGFRLLPVFLFGARE